LLNILINVLNIADFYLNMGIKRVKGGGNWCKEAGGRLVVLPTANKPCFCAMAKGFFTPLLPPHCLFKQNYQNRADAPLPAFHFYKRLGLF